MAFFGLTTLGVSDPVKEGTKLSESYKFHNIPEEAYHELFQRHVLGDSDVAQALQVDGSQHILRAKLGDMLKELLGRPPRKFELQAWFTHFDYERTALMSFEEYLKGLERLLTFSAGQEKPISTTSYDTQHTEWTRHTRVGYELQQTYKAPMTTAQDIGWHATKTAPTGTDKRAALNHTDVTLKEGRTAVSYYGYFACQ